MREHTHLSTELDNVLHRQRQPYLPTSALIAKAWAHEVDNGHERTPQSEDDAEEALGRRNERDQLVCQWQQRCQPREVDSTVVGGREGPKLSLNVRDALAGRADVADDEHDGCRNDG